MRLYAITPEHPLPDEPRRIARLLDERGFDAVHLRHPGLTADELCRLIEAVPERLHGRLRLHDAFDAARRFAVGALHLNGRNPETPDWWHGPLGRSCHSLAELGRARDDGMAYATISPVFDSLSKAGYRAAFTDDELRRAAATPGLEVVALGGVTPDRLPHLAELGFGACAMLTAAWQL